MLDSLRHLLPIGAPVGETVHPFVEIARQALRVPRNLIPAGVEIVVTIVVTLHIGGMRAEGFLHHGIHTQTWDQGTIRIAAYHLRSDDLFDNHHYASARKGSLLVHAHQSPDLCVPFRIGAL